MRKEEIDYLQGIAEKILLLCANAQIENEEVNKKAVQFRRSIKIVFGDEMKQNPAWTEKEMREMPYLKDLSYRFTSGVHQYRYRRNGYNVQFSSKNKEIAKKKAREFIKSINETLTTTAPTKITLDYVAGLWFENKQAHTAEVTCRMYRNVYKKNIFPVFGDKAVKNILPIHLQPFFNELFKVKERTCEDAKFILNGIFNLAVANRFCLSNPMQGVIVEKHFRKKGVALNDEQLARFKSVMNQSGKYGLAGLIILYSGVRGAELSSIRFDWDGGTMTIDNAKLKKSQKSNPLNLVRTIPIFPGLYALRERIEATDEWRIHGDMLTKRFCLYWRENSVKDLRHTFISRLRESGIENELVSIWTGHSAGKNVTANTYTHFSMDFQKEQAKKVKAY